MEKKNPKTNKNYNSARKFKQLHLCIYVDRLFKLLYLILWSKGKSTNRYPLYKDYEHSENVPTAALPNKVNISVWIYPSNYFLNR